MKAFRIFSILAIMTFTINSFSQNTYVGDAEFTSQAEVDDFGSNNYTEITGYLSIHSEPSSNIIDLTPLSSLSIIGAGLHIYNNSVLLSLDGLNNITDVGTSLLINDNSSLLNLDDINSINLIGETIQVLNNNALLNVNGLSGISTVIQDLRIFGNDNLINLNGLHNITNIGGSLWIEDNDSLQNINELSNLSAINENVWVEKNDGLINIDGLNNINSVEQNLVIKDNSSLINIHGLNNITSVGEQLICTNNDALTNIDGLLNITSITTNTYINDNDVLTNLNGLNNLISIGNVLEIVSNDELADLCGLQTLLNAGGLGGIYTVTDNAYNPTEQNIIDSDCSALIINFALSYPKLNDYYIVGQNIRLQFIEDSYIPINSAIDYSYSFDNGNTWVSEGFFVYLSQEQGFDWVAPIVNEPIIILVKVEASINGADFEFISSSFVVQPINYYETDGFLNDGVSELGFNLQGLIDDDNGWKITSSTAHKCLDANSQDWNYYNENVECGLDIRSPFNGKVIGVIYETNDDLCNNFPSPKKYGKQIIIQSTVDKTIAFRVAHLKYTHPDITLNAIVSEGSLIGKVGGTGTMFTHAHTSLYKNIYGWFPLTNTDSGEQTMTIKELLRNGGSFTDPNNNYPVECNYFETNHSAEFNFNSNNIVSIVDNNIPTQDELITFNSNLYTSLNLDLFLGTITLTKETLRQSEIINSLDGLETLLSIDGNLTISETNITNLDGLQNLTHVGGNVIIENNNLLSDFCGLYALIENNGIGGDLIIENNLYNPTAGDILDELNCDGTLTISEPILNNDIYIYPNPTNDIVFFKSNNIIDSVEIFDIYGKLLLKLNNPENISFSKFFEGIYILKFKTYNRYYVKKVIKSN